jgi:hypothetical protein
VEEEVILEQELVQGVFFDGTDGWYQGRESM